MHRLLAVLLFLSAGFSAGGALAAVPRLDRLVEVAPNRIVLIGAFGHPCRDCHVAVVPRRGPPLRYVTRHWTPNRIELTLRDVGGSPDVAVAVVRPEGRSRALPYRIRPRLLPPPGGEWVLRGSHGGRRPDQGVDRYPVAVAPPPCGAAAQAFDHAVLEVDRRRGGDAILRTEPPSGCLGDCPPIEVGWMHEPGGAVEYRLRIYRRAVTGVCDPMPGD